MQKNVIQKVFVLRPIAEQSFQVDCSVWTTCVMHHGTNTSEKASSLSGGISVGSRSDDEKVKAMMTFDSEEAWPTLDQSREHSIKKKPNSVSSSEKRLVSDRSRKGRQNRGVPLSPEEQNKLFYNEKSDRLSKERRERVIEKERSHQRRHSLQNDFRPHSYSKPKEPSEPEPTPIDASAVQPLKDVTPRFQSFSILSFWTLISDLDKEDEVVEGFRDAAERDADVPIIPVPIRTILHITELCHQVYIQCILLFRCFLQCIILRCRLMDRCLPCLACCIRLDRCQPYPCLDFRDNKLWTQLKNKSNIILVKRT